MRHETKTHLPAIGRLFAGAARVDITPEGPAELAGFARQIQPSVRVNDPLQACSLVLSDGNTTVFTVVCDLLVIPAEFARRLRCALQKRFGVRPEQVMLCATHNHFSPKLPWETETSPAWTDENNYACHLLKKAISCAEQAYARLQPAVLGAGAGTCALGINRRQRMADGRVDFGQNPEGFVDRTLGVCRIDTMTGEPLATVVNFAMHPVVLDYKYRVVSADYCGALRDAVEKAVGGVCLFWQGALGEVNPRRLDADYAEACRQGRQVAEEVVRIRSGIGPRPVQRVQALSKLVPLPPYRRSSLQHAEAYVRQVGEELAGYRRLPDATPGTIAYFEAVLERAQNMVRSWKGEMQLPSVTAELQVCRCGDWAWAAINAEVFGKNGVAYKSLSTSAHTFFVSLANGGIWYLPTRQAYEEGGAEVDHLCWVSSEAPRIVHERFRKLFGLVNRDADNRTGQSRACLEV